jgi:prephenate dehydratase
MEERVTTSSEGVVVAIQGVAGAFSHEAAERLYGKEIRLVSARTFDDLMAAVAGGDAARGLVPVENTLAGFVQGNLDRIVQAGLHVVGETRVRIRLSFLAPPRRELSEIRTAASHPVALQQCTRFFREHPDIEPVAVYDTAGSVQDLMSGEAGYDAAIGSALAGSLYGAATLFSQIEDDHRNHTRFFAVAREDTDAQPPVTHSGVADPSILVERQGPADKTSIAFVVAHEPGSLYRSLGVFANRGVDLTKLESRPIPGRPWEYRFYADLRGDPGGEVGESIEELKGMAAELTVLGSYKEWMDED